MKLTVFGASGNTGSSVVSLAIKAGHDVSVLVREPAKLCEDIKAKLFKIVVGDVLNDKAVHDVISGNEGVIVALGTRNDLSPTTVMSEGLKNILAAMKSHDIKRISVCLSAFVFYEDDKLPPRFLDINAEHKRMLTALQNSDREWVAVCPPHIADDPPTNDYKIQIGKSLGRRIAKEDLADCLIKCVVSDTEYIHQAVGLGYETPA